MLDARRKRRQADAGLIDWVMVRNRMGTLASNNARQIANSLARLAPELLFRVAEGLHDRVIFRELFPIGLTVLDPIESPTRSGAPTGSHAAARQEIATLSDTLHLPKGGDALGHLDARHRWFDTLSAYYRDLAAQRAGPAANP